jgi:hypothetical protein
MGALWMMAESLLEELAARIPSLKPHARAPAASSALSSARFWRGAPYVWSSLAGAARRFEAPARAEPHRRPELILALRAPYPNPPVSVMVEEVNHAR